MVPSSDGLIPAQELDAERLLLGALLRNPKAFDEVTAIVSRGNFVVPAHAAVFEALVAVQSKGWPCNERMFVEQHLRETGMLEEIGGTETLTKLFELQPQGDASQYATMVRDNSLRRQIATCCREVAERARLGQKPDDLMRSLESVFKSSNFCRDYELHAMTSAEFATADFKLEWLVKGVLVKGQPVIVGGPEKCLKTGCLVDLAISIATGTPFMGNEAFEVPCPRRVCVLSGESGGAKLRAAAQAVCDARGIRLKDVDVLWQFELPKLADPRHLRGIKQSIVKDSIDVLIIDPAYLCLLAGDERNRSAGNVFDMGSLLREVGQLGQDTGCTIVLCHHTTKRERRYRFTRTTLEDLSQAGFREFARQWLLLGRKSPYQNNGRHELWLDIGGSAGQSGAYVLTIDEGVIDENFAGRKWQCRAEDACHAAERATHDKDRRKAVQYEQHHREQLDRLKAVVDECGSNGDTKSVLRSKARLKSNDFDELAEELLKQGAIERCQVMKGNRHHDGYRRVSRTPSAPHDEAFGTSRTQSELPSGSDSFRRLSESVGTRPPLSGAFRVRLSPA